MIENPTDAIRYQYDNHLGSASLELDNNANIISYEEYHPFGTTSYRSGKTETETSQKRYKYVGKECDNETGLYYYGARYYAAWICRFVSVDPLAEKFSSWTPYHYVHNNPIVLIDPKGESADWFQNDLTGDVYYNSEMKKGDEGTGEMKGEGWKHLGENGMFNDGTPMKDDVPLLYKNLNLTEKGVIQKENYDYTNWQTGDIKKTYTVEAMFKGENAEKFMDKQGYEFLPTQQTIFTAGIFEKLQMSVGTRSISSSLGTIYRITEKSIYLPKESREVSQTKSDDTEILYDTTYGNKSSIGRYKINYTQKKELFVIRLLKLAAPLSGMHNDLHTPVSKNWKYFNVKSKLVTRYLETYDEK